MRPGGLSSVRLALAYFGWALLIRGPAFADVVVPTSDVVTSVAVRQSASAQSARIGRLSPGEQPQLQGRRAAAWESQGGGIR